MSETKWEILDLDSVDEDNEEIVFDFEKDEEEVEVELDNEKRDSKSDRDTGDEDEEDPEEDPEEKTEEDETEEDPEDEENLTGRRRKRTRAKKRAEKRIQSLQDQNSVLQKQLEELVGVVSTITPQINSLKQQDKLSEIKRKKESVQEQLAKAHEEGDSNEIARLQGEMTKVTFEETVLSLATDSPNTQGTQQKREQTQQKQWDTSAYEEFLEENDWLDEPETDDEAKAQRYANRVVTKLLKEEGEDYKEDPEMYEEVIEAVYERAKEKGWKLPGMKQELTTKKPVKQKAGPTSSAKTAPREKSSRKKVTLTADEQDIIRRLSITPEDYIKHKLKQESTTKKPVKQKAGPTSSAKTAPREKSSRKKVTLTADEQDIIRRLSITPEDYIKHKLKQERKGNTFKTDIF